MPEIDQTFIIGQIVGFIMLAINVASFQLKTNTKTILMHCIVNLLGLTHFYLLGEAVGVALSALVFTRNFVSLKIPEKYLKHLIIFSLCATWLLTTYFYNGHYDIAAGVSITLATIALLWRDSSTLIFKSMHFLARCSWLTYVIAVISIPGIINSIMMMGSIAIGMIRHEERFAPLKKALKFKQD